MVRKHQTSDAQLRIGESRDSGFDAGACHRAAHRADPVASPRNDGGSITPSTRARRGNLSKSWQVRRRI